MKSLVLAVALFLSMATFAGDDEKPLGPGPCPKGEKGDIGPKGDNGGPVGTVSRGLKSFAGKMEHDVGGGLKMSARKIKHFFNGGSKEVEKKDQKK